MACTVCGPRQRSTSGNIEVSGTWDYKWPRGTRIRVAFQRRSDLSENQFSALTEKVVDLARRWERAVADYLEQNEDIGLTATEFASSGISFDFLPERILDAPLGDEGPDGSELRSPYTPEELAERDYDVLINLANLPLVRSDPFRSPISISEPSLMRDGEQEGIQEITLPFTALGSYARRLDYGLPTAFLGNPMRSHQGRAADYLDSVAGAHIVVHEFGHILGLAHAHQAPQFAQASFRPDTEIAQMLQQAFNLEDPIPAQFIREQITARWPGNPEFSDWRMPRTLGELRSIMAHPDLPSMLASANGLAPATAAKAFAEKFVRREAELAPDERYGLTEPTELDIEGLLYMYGGRGARAALSRRPRAAGQQ